MAPSCVVLADSGALRPFPSMICVTRTVHARFFKITAAPTAWVRQYFCCSCQGRQLYQDFCTICFRIGRILLSALTLDRPGKGPSCCKCLSGRVYSPRLSFLKSMISLRGLPNVGSRISSSLRCLYLIFFFSNLNSNLNSIWR